MKNIFLTGEIQIGKSTLLRKVLKVLDETNLTIGGFQTDRNMEDDKTDFVINSIFNNSSYRIATINSIGSDFKITAYTKSFEDAANTIIRDSIKKCDVIVLDELGFLESKALDFQKSVFEALDSSRIVLGVIKPKPITFLNKIRERNDISIYQVTKNNRNNLLCDIIKEIYC